MIDQDAFILGLFSRIKALEEKVERLEAEHSPDFEPFDDSAIEEAEIKITRSIARKHVIDQMKDLNSSYTVIIGSRSTSADLIIQNGSTLHVKFYFSKSYMEELPSSWYVVKKSDIYDHLIDLCIFTLTYKDEFHTLLLTPQEIESLVQEKQISNGDKYHFYFQKREDRFLEVRDEELDVTEFYERWNVINELMERSKSAE